jgi:hypothetical protein
MIDVMNNLDRGRLPVNYNNIFFTGRGTTLPAGSALFNLGRRLPQGKSTVLNMNDVLRRVPPLMRHLHDFHKPLEDEKSDEVVGGRPTESSSSQSLQRSSGGDGDNQSISLSSSSSQPPQKYSSIMSSLYEIETPEYKEWKNQQEQQQEAQSKN